MMFFLLSARKYKFSKLTRESRVLNKIIPHINVRVRQKHKHCFLKEFRESNFSLIQVQILGLKFSKHLWYSCLILNERNVVGGSGINEMLKEKINTFLEINSEIAANRTSLQITRQQIKRKKNGVIKYQKNERNTENSRYMTKSITELQKSFNEEIHNELELIPSHSCFFKHRKNFFKTAKRKSDMCVIGNIDGFIKLHFNELEPRKF
jgi:hypothetical protein